MKEIFEKLATKQDLSEGEIEEVFNRILNGELTESQIAALLLGLKMKGETVDEIAGVVKSLKKHAVQLPQTYSDAMCNCGTGGDQSYSFNISTTACFILAAGGIRLAKAGNRSISSKSGSADVLEELGINIAANPEVLSKALSEVVTDLSCEKKKQTMHPAMRFIGPARRALGVPTIMNIVGPLANPLSLDSQLMGVYREDLQLDLAHVMKKMGRRRALLITGPNHMDEAALFGENHYTLLTDGNIHQGSFTFADVDLNPLELADIQGGDAVENAEILLSVLQNQASPYLETTVLNAGLGFYANGKVSSIREGVELARSLLADGSALRKLEELREVQI